MWLSLGHRHPPGFHIADAACPSTNVYYLDRNCSSGTGLQTMPPKPRHSQPKVATQTPGFQTRVSRTMPVTYTEPMDFRPHGMNEGLTSSHFAYASSSWAPGRHSSSGTGPLSTGSYSDSDDYVVVTSSAMAYPSLSISESPYNMPMMSSMSGFDSDPAYEFLTDDVVSGTSAADLKLAQTNYQGQGQTQDLMEPSYISMDSVDSSSLYMPGVMNNFYSSDLSWQNRILTPPPEDYVQEILPQHFLTAQDYQSDLCQHNRTLSAHNETIATRKSSSSSSSSTRRSLPQPRPLRSASERSDSTTGDYCTRMSEAELEVSRDEQVDKLKARSNPLYDAKPDRDGWYRCPLVKEAKCAHKHKPTKQRCIYNKYLDSHLKPYKCRFADRPECEDARFSSNACLFRHEREAHGLHNHGLNPFLCKFPDCDRAREGNGFPRRWNQRDHMKRVHEYVEEDSPMDRTAATTSHDQAKRRKVPVQDATAPTSTAMKRTSSSAHARAQAMAAATVSPRYYGRTVSQSRYNAPSMYQ
ncbi:hypothetical protein ABEF92_005880 [Exophiala dermatitidis]|uniref:C2H2-type domain-containing protein n=2 Tax=Exophiala dermatitidis TaxID=5970 RepID=H6C8C9_EXODN|nr:uncharacterized protein HMPREF1120_08321 [Exophiala dermatitidis NIH/UT8656]EHY60356.1 hypothetical protein HMPREF1120_08321 [Exophiala dermatitidis NIH/UT8656]